MVVSTVVAGLVPAIRHGASLLLMSSTSLAMTTNGAWPTNRTESSALDSYLLRFRACCMSCYRDL